MFSKILGKITGGVFSNDKAYKELLRRISKMHLRDMKDYVRNKIPDMKIDEDGITEVMKKLVDKDEITSQRYLIIDDMDSKIRKCMELVLIISESNHITVVAIEKIQEFIDVYEDIIKRYDTENKDIYASRLKKALSKGIDRVNAMVDMKRRMDVTAG